MNLAVIFEKKCRICAADILDIEKFVTIFSYVGLEEIIRKHLGINVTKDDKLPKLICEKCFTKLEDIREFSALAIKTEQEFYSHLENLKTKQSPINEELTFENIINNNIIKKFRSEQVCVWSQKDISIVEYDDLKVGQLIKDHEFLRLIIKALKWDVNSKPIDVQLELLKNKNFRDILTNTNLLKDSDLIQLLKSYMGQDTFTNISKHKEETDLNLIYNGDESITQMEVGVDPALFFPYEDTCSKENEFDGKDLDLLSKKFLFNCTICTQEFETNILLQEHLGTHLLKHKNTLIKRRKSRRSRKGTKKISQFKCVVCGKILSTKGNLKVHVNTHKPKGKYSCEKCGRIFKSIVNLLRHKEYHSEIQYSCNVCGRVYPTNSTLKAHSITHSTERPHECPLCDKNFKRNQDLKFHINQHTGARPYQCPKCPKAFASSGNCFSHRKRMHPELMERPKVSESLS